MKKTVIRIVCFVLILIFVLVGVNNIFKVKYGDGIYDVTKFYELENDTVDVLILGSSHAFQDFNTGVLWNEYGMASYILGGSVQPMWNTYYYLKEALKTQTPELIVLEAYMTSFLDEYSDDSRIIKNNYGLKWSVDKINSLMVSIPRERWSEFFLEYPQYHTRYTELSSEDFLENLGNTLFDDWKGFGCNMVTTSLENVDISHIEDEIPLIEKTEKYYRKVIELAKEHDIPILVVVSPYAGITEDEQAMYNMAENIADEYDVEFVNYNLNYRNIGIDYVTDVADAGHLNYRGNVKFTKEIGKYIVDNYQVTDRRGNTEYQTWQDNADYIEELISNQKLLECVDVILFLEQMNNPNYKFLVSVDGTIDSDNLNFVSIISALNIDYIGTNGLWITDNEDIIWSSGNNTEVKQYFTFDRHDICMERLLVDDNGDYANKIIVDNCEYKKVVNGINILVYSIKTESVVDCIGINADTDYTIVR